MNVDKENIKNWTKLGILSRVIVFIGGEKMKKTILWIALLAFGLTAAHRPALTVAQEANGSTNPYVKKVYIQVSGANIYGKSNQWKSLNNMNPDPSELKSFLGSVFGAGITLGKNTGKYYFDLEFDYDFLKIVTATTVFSGRYLRFYNFIFNFGYVPNINIPLSFYGSFGGAWVTETGKDGRGPIIFGLGAKFALPKFLAFRFDFKYYLDGRSYSSSGWQPVDSSGGMEMKFLGTRIGFGIELRFSFKKS